MKKFYLTRRALYELRDIRDYSVEQFGKATAQKYISEVMIALQEMADTPEIGHLREHRSWPFLMAPAGKHFAIYKIVGDGIAVATILHSRRDIESLIRSLGDKLAKEIDDLL